MHRQGNKPIWCEINKEEAAQQNDVKSVGVREGAYHDPTTFYPVIQRAVVRTRTVLHLAR